MTKKYRFRKFREGIRIEKLEEGKWIGCTLDAEKTYNWAMYSKKDENVYNPTKEENGESTEKFSQSLLTEGTQNEESVHIPDFKPVEVDKLIPDIDKLKKILRMGDENGNSNNN